MDDRFPVPYTAEPFRRQRGSRKKAPPPPAATTPPPRPSPRRRRPRPHQAVATPWPARPIGRRAVAGPPIPAGDPVGVLTRRPSCTVARIHAARPLVPTTSMALWRRAGSIHVPRVPGHGRTETLMCQRGVPGHGLGPHPTCQRCSRARPGNCIRCANGVPGHGRATASMCQRCSRARPGNCIDGSTRFPGRHGRDQHRWADGVPGSLTRPIDAAFRDVAGGVSREPESTSVAPWPAARRRSQLPSGNPPRCRTIGWRGSAVHGSASTARVPARYQPRARQPFAGGGARGPASARRRSGDRRRPRARPEGRRRRRRRTGPPSAARPLASAARTGPWRPCRGQRGSPPGRACRTDPPGDHQALSFEEPESRLGRLLRNAAEKRDLTQWNGQAGQRREHVSGQRERQPRLRLVVHREGENRPGQQRVKPSRCRLLATWSWRALSRLIGLTYAVRMPSAYVTTGRNSGAGVPSCPVMPTSAARSPPTSGRRIVHASAARIVSLPAAFSRSPAHTVHQRSAGRPARRPHVALLLGLRYPERISLLRRWRLALRGWPAARRLRLAYLSPLCHLATETSQGARSDRPEDGSTGSGPPAPNSVVRCGMCC